MKETIELGCHFSTLTRSLSPLTPNSTFRPLHRSALRLFLGHTLKRIHMRTEGGEWKGNARYDILTSSSRTDGQVEQQTDAIRRVDHWTER